MSAVITAALRDSQMKRSRWWSCSVFFTLTPSASPSFFGAADLQPPFCHCHGWAHRSRLLSPILFKDKILTMHGSWIAVVSILRVIHPPRNPTVAFPDSQLLQQTCGETRRHLLKATIKNHRGNKKERYRNQLSLLVPVTNLLLNRLVWMMH